MADTPVRIVIETVNNSQGGLDQAKASMLGLGMSAEEASASTEVLGAQLDVLLAELQLIEAKNLKSIETLRLKGMAAKQAAEMEISAAMAGIEIKEREARLDLGYAAQQDKQALAKAKSTATLVEKNAAALAEIEVQRAKDLASVEANASEEFRVKELQFQKETAALKAALIEQQIARSEAAKENKLAILAGQAELAAMNHSNSMSSLGATRGAGRIADLGVAETAAYAEAAKRAEQGGSKLAKAFGQVSKASVSSATGVKGMSSALTALGGGPVIAAIAAATAVIGLGIAAVRTSVQIETLTAGIRNYTDTQDQANGIMSHLEALSETIPQSLESVTGAWDRFRRTGITTNDQLMKDTANLAAGQHKSMGDMAKSMSLASEGNTRGLKEMGITAVQEGDKMKVTFQGVTETIGRNQKDIVAYMEKIAEQRYGDAAANQANTVSGAWQLMKNEVTLLMASLGDSGLTSVISGVINWLTSLLKEIRENMGGIIKYGTVVTETFEIVGSTIRMFAQATWDTIKGLFTLIGNAIGNTARAIWDLFTGDFAGAKDAAKNIVGDLKEDWNKGWGEFDKNVQANAEKTAGHLVDFYNTSMKSSKQFQDDLNKKGPNTYTSLDAGHNTGTSSESQLRDKNVKPKHDPDEWMNAFGPELKKGLQDARNEMALTELAIDNNKLFNGGLFDAKTMSQIAQSGDVIQKEMALVKEKMADPTIKPELRKKLADFYTHLVDESSKDSKEEAKQKFAKNLAPAEMLKEMFEQADLRGTDLSLFPKDIDTQIKNTRDNLVDMMKGIKPDTEVAKQEIRQLSAEIKQLDKERDELIKSRLRPTDLAGKDAGYIDTQLNAKKSMHERLSNGEANGMLGKLQGDEATIRDGMANIGTSGLDKDGQDAQLAKLTAQLDKVRAAQHRVIAEGGTWKQQWKQQMQDAADSVKPLGQALMDIGDIIKNQFEQSFTSAFERIGAGHQTLMQGMRQGFHETMRAAMQALSHEFMVRAMGSFAQAILGNPAAAAQGAAYLAAAAAASALAGAGGGGSGGGGGGGGSVSNSTKDQAKGDSTIYLHGDGVFLGNNAEGRDKLASLLREVSDRNVNVVAR